MNVFYVFCFVRFFQGIEREFCVLVVLYYINFGIGSCLVFGYLIQVIKCLVSCFVGVLWCFFYLVGGNFEVLRGKNEFFKFIVWVSGKIEIGLKIFIF